MAVFNITSGNIGAQLATNGSLVGVAQATKPGGLDLEAVTVSGWYGVPSSRYLCLVDDSGPGAPRTLVNYDPYTGPFADLKWSGVPFGNLRVASVPGRGTAYTVTTA